MFFPLLLLLSDADWLADVLRRIAASASAGDAPFGGSVLFYHVELWEAAVLAVHFAVMALLSVYGLHRAQLIWLYLRHKPAASPPPPLAGNELPTVTVQLPVYNERFVVAGLIDCMCRLDYPRDRLEIQVLDDSTDDTALIAAAAVERAASLGHPIRLLHRDCRDGFKAGALAAGLEQARGDLIAVFDADFRPEPDFLRRTVGHFEDAAVGAVQGRWTYSNRDESLLTKVQGLLLDSHFAIEQGARSRSGRMFNFNGTGGVLRKAMIVDAGGWQHDTLAEDTDLSYRAQTRGWRFVFRPDIEVPSELPADMGSFQKQQARWAKGLVQTGLKLLPGILRSPRSAAVKLEAFLHLSANLSYPLMALLAAVILPASVIRFERHDARLLAFDGVVFITTFVSLAAYYLLARRELNGRVEGGAWALIPAAMAVGIGLTFSNLRAVAEAVAGVATPFERTAKCASNGRSSTLAKRFYRRPGGWLPWVNLAASAYFVGAAIYTASIGAWASVPFLALFVAGYLYAGGLSLYESLDEQRLAIIDAQDLAPKAGSGAASG